MNMHICPHCQMPGISGLRRAFLGPGLPAKCSQCGKKVSVPYWSILTIVPMLAGFLGAPLVTDNSFIAAGLAMYCTATTFTLWAALVPLEKR